MSSDDKLAPTAARTWVTVACIAIGFTPLLYCHVTGMLLRPHYQFIAILPVALWIIHMTLSTDNKPEATPTDVGAAIAVLSVAAVGLLFAAWAWSPWIAAVSGMFAFAAVLLRLGGRNLFRNWLPIWIYCLILIPLPFGMDEDLVVSLRTVTTRLSSSVLDQLGILHQAYANVIQLPDKALFVADACSGIQSLYVLLAMALFVSVLMRRNVIHSLLLLASTFGLVIIENVARICSVAWASRHSMDWSQGTNHEVLGVILFIASAVLVLSTDQLLIFLLPESWIDLVRAARRLSPRSRIVPTKPTPEPQPMKPWLTTAWFAIACVFPVLGLMQLPRVGGNAPPITRLFSDDPTLAIFGEDAMPAEWLGFRRVGYEQITRVPGDPFGQSSQRWIYEKEGMTVGFSIDYPYDGGKDLCQCYEMTGWTINDKAYVSTEELQRVADVNEDTSPCARAGIEREMFGEGLLLFSSLDRNGEPEVVLKELARGDTSKRMADRWSYAQGGGDQELSLHGQPPFTQMHVLARSFNPMTEETRNELIRFFLKSRALMSPRIIESLRDDTKLPALNAAAGDDVDVSVATGGKP